MRNEELEESKSLFAFHSKAELAENFLLEELLNFAKQRNLQEWLAENFYASEARKVAAAINNEVADADLKLLICKLFNLPLETLSAEEAEEISATVAKNQRRELFIKKIPGDDRKIDFVENQAELFKALQGEAQIIYLCGGEFRIPLNRRGVTYIGCENAVVDVDEEFDIDFDAAEIVLEDLQIYLHNPIKITAAQSKNLKILDGSKKILGDRPTLKEIFDILRGRKSFETPEGFKSRAENIQQAAVGVALLDDKNYDIDAAQFDFKPQWNFDYISVLKDFAADKKFSMTLRANDAENLYSNERKLQIFADFTAQGGKLTILNLYFATKTLGKIMIEAALIAEKISSTSSGGELGYGLDIITAYERSPIYAVTVTIENKFGIHARSAANFVQKTSSFKSKIQVIAKGKCVDAKSILMIMSLGLVKGTEVTIVAKGSDAQEAIKTLKEFVDNRCDCYDCW